MLRPSLAAALVLASLASTSPAAAQEPAPAATQEPAPADATPSAPPTVVPAAPEAPAGVAPAPGAPSDPSTNEAGKRVGVGIDAVVVVPIGDLATATGPLAGPLVRFGYRIIDGFELSVRAGYLFAASKDQGKGVVSKLDILPVWLEARWLFLKPFSGPYAAVSGGLNLYVPTVTPPIPGPAGDTVTETRRRLGASAGAGYILSDNLPIDLRAQISLFNLIGQDQRLNETEDIGLALTAGYTLLF